MNHLIPQNATSISGINHSQTATGASAKISVLESQMNLLHSAVDEHDRLIDRLMETFETVMMPSFPDTHPKEPQPPQEQLSPAATYIRTARERLQRQSARLSDLIERQQVR